MTEVKKVKDAAITEARNQEKERQTRIVDSQTPKVKRTIEQLSQPGASSWLGALPIQEKGFNLTKGKFHDALALRYNRTVKNLPSRCPCDAPFTPTHALNCHRGGFVNARHNNIRYFECSLLKTVVNDVECEPMLQHVVNKEGYTQKLQSWTMKLA